MSDEISNSKCAPGIVNCLAVTEVTEKIFVFRWNIQGFKVLLKDKEPNSSMRSPEFWVEEGSVTHKWSLEIKWGMIKIRDGSNEEDQYLSIHLNLRNSSTKVTFEFEIMDSEKCWKKLTSELRTFDTETSWGWDKFAKIQDILLPTNKLLEDGALKLQCCIKMKRDEGRIVKTLTSKNTNKCNNGRKCNVSNLYNSPLFSDISIQTRNSIVKAHKNILSSQSPVFSTMLQTEMSESINNIVEICDFDDDVVKEMLKYIYGCEAHQEFLEKKAMDMFQIADKYDIQVLKEDVEEIISRKISIENVSETLIFADMNNASNLKKSAVKFFNKNLAKVKETEGFQQLKMCNPSIFMDLYLEI